MFVIFRSISLETAAGLRLMVVMMSASIVGAVGCGGGPKKPDWPELVAAGGKITANGNAIANARVFFSPKGGTPGLGASGTTDQSGRYLLSSISAEGKLINGAIPGEYRVAVSLMKKPSGEVLPADSQEPPATSGARESLPMHYSDINLTRLIGNVPAGGTIDLNYELTGLK